jgi:XTP/dITP diphosphohydrolase
MKIVLATNNADKVREFENILGKNMLISSSGFDVEETGQTFAENAKLKALAFARLLNLPALGDDSGLCIEALDGAPGLYSARYAPTMETKLARILDEMKDVADGDRGAIYVCALCLAFPDGRMIEVQAECSGRITRSPRGKYGFGYDSIFESKEFDLTYGEIGEEIKSKISHRGRAVAKIKEIMGDD